jgi:hypothetical protein
MARTGGVVDEILNVREYQVINVFVFQDEFVMANMQRTGGMLAPALRNAIL